MTVTLCRSCSPDVGVYSIGAFPRSPEVWCGLSFHISSLTLCESAGNCIGGFPSASSVGCGLPYHISSLTLWESAGNCIGGFRGPPRSGVAFPTTSGLYCLEVCWQLHRGFSECPLGRVWPSLPHLVSTVWNSTGNSSGTQTQLS